MDANFDDQARIIQKVKAELGWTDDIGSFSKRVNELHKGLIHEDEFLYLLNWTGRCTFFHKLDQSITPPNSKETYNIPDIFAVFNVGGKSTKYLIEIKTSAKNSLSWTESYYQGLKRYSQLVGIPVLVAWKWSWLDIWTVFDINHFKKGPSNYKIGLEKAHQENLMSQIVGDYFIKPFDEFSLFLKFRKIKKIKDVQNEATWEAITDEIYFLGEDGKKIKGLDPSIFSLILSFETEVETVENETHIINRYYPHPNKAAYAQSVLIRLANALSDGEVNWIQKIRENKYPVTYNKLYKAVEVGLDSRLIRNILFQEPLTKSEMNG